MVKKEKKKKDQKHVSMIILAFFMKHCSLLNRRMLISASSCIFSPVWQIESLSSNCVWAKNKTSRASLYICACVLVSGGLLARWRCVSSVCASPSPSFTLILSVSIKHLPPVCFNLCNRILQFSSSGSFGFSLFSPSHSHSVCLSLFLFTFNFCVLSRNRTTIPVH